jgi:hypothetical protein
MATSARSGHSLKRKQACMRDPNPAARAIVNNPAPTTTALRARSTAQQAGARRSTVMATPASAGYRLNGLPSRGFEGRERFFHFPPRVGFLVPPQRAASGPSRWRGRCSRRARHTGEPRSRGTARASRPAETRDALERHAPSLDCQSARPAFTPAGRVPIVIAHRATAAVEDNPPPGAAAFRRGHGRD